MKRTGEYSAANINNTSIFIDRDGDGALEIQLDDWVVYPYMAMAEEIHQPVTLLWRDGGYHIAVDVVRRARMTDKELAANAMQLRAKIAKDRDGLLELSHDVMDMLYGGNGDQAARYIELAWPGNDEEKKEFIEQVQKQLANDQYVREMTEARERTLPKSR